MERLIGLYHRYGLLGVAGIIGLVEAGVLFFLPDEGLLLYIGLRIRQGHHALPAALLTIGTSVLLGSSALYWLMRWKGHPLLVRYGRYLGLDRRRIDLAERSLRRWGDWAILGGRMIPGLRLGLTVVAGLLEFPFPRFLGLMALATQVWLLLYLGAGYYLGERALREDGVFQRALGYIESHQLVTLTTVLTLVVISLLWRRQLRRWNARRLGFLSFGPQHLHQIEQQPVDHKADRD